MRLLGLLILLCLACDFFMMPLLAVMPRTPILCFPLLLASVGCALAQMCLLAAWLAWSDQPFGQRLGWHWIIAAILYAVWAAGLACGLPSRFVLAGSLVGLSIPLVSIAAQLPLWFARQAFGWRLVRDDASKAPGVRPLSIRDLMLATMLVALALAPARWVPSPDGKEMGTLWIVAFVAAATISTLTLLPATPLLLRTRQFQHGIWFACLYAVFWMTLPWVVVLIVRSRGIFAGPPLPVLIGLSCLVLSFAATVILALAAARARGYRLAWGR
jgi:hypothetical protein